MKTFQRLCVGVVLTLAFTMPAFADGHMGTPRTEPPPPTSSLTQSDITEAPTGHMPTGPGATTTEGDSITEVVWGLLEGVLALF